MAGAPTSSGGLRCEGADEEAEPTVECSTATMSDLGPEATLLPREHSGPSDGAGNNHRPHGARGRWRSWAGLVTTSAALLATLIFAMALVFAPVDPHWWRTGSVSFLLDKFQWPWAELFLGRDVKSRGWAVRTVATTTPKPLPYPALLCYLITRTQPGENATREEALAANQEFEMVRLQYMRKAGIFACDHYVVFSDQEVYLSSGPNPYRTSKLHVSLRSKAGKIEHILNAYIFMEAWHQVLQNADFRRYDYIIKADPDAVFFPARLRTHLREEFPHPDRSNHSLYVLNCKFGFGFYGALEVISRGAAEAYFNGYPKCTAALPWKEYGEDLFMKKCLDMLGVSAVKDYSMVGDAYCGEVPGDCTTGKVAYHPLKNAEVYFHCHNKALGINPNTKMLGVRR